MLNIIAQYYYKIFWRWPQDVQYQWGISWLTGLRLVFLGFKGPLNAQIFGTNLCANFQYFPHTRTNIFVQIFGKWHIFIRVKTILKVCAKNCAIVTLDLNWNYANSQSLSKVITGYDDMRLSVGGRIAKSILKSFIGRDFQPAAIDEDHPIIQWMILEYVLHFCLPLITSYRHIP